jgi:hypothetical protein
MFTCEAHGAPLRSILLGLAILRVLHDKLASAILTYQYI